MMITLGGLYEQFTCIFPFSNCSTMDTLLNIKIEEKHQQTSMGLKHDCEKTEKIREAAEL